MIQYAFEILTYSVNFEKSARSVFSCPSLSKRYNEGIIKRHVLIG